MAIVAVSPANFPYISIQFGGITLTWKGGAPDYFTSLSHKRVNDQGNTMSLSITYCPQPGEDPNAVERAIVASKGECLVSYGYSRPLVRSKLFKALVYDYNVTFSNGALNYSFKLVSAAVAYSTVTGTTAVIKKHSEVRPQIEQLMKKLKNDYELVYELQGYRVPENGITVTKAMSPLEAIRHIVHKLEPSHEDMVYSVIVDDSGEGRGKIKLLTNKNTVAQFRFDWHTRNASIFDWSPEFNGSVAIMRARAGMDATTKYITNVSENDGTYEKFSIKGVDTLPATEALKSSSLPLIERIMQEKAYFIKYANYAYRATLTVLGQVDDTIINQTKIIVEPMIYGQNHHSAGQYIVIGVEDQVDSGGFRTTFTLYRDTKFNIYGYDLDSISNDIIMNSKSKYYYNKVDEIVIGNENRYDNWDPAR